MQPQIEDLSQGRAVGWNQNTRVASDGGKRSPFRGISSERTLIDFQEGLRRYETKLTSTKSQKVPKSKLQWSRNTHLAQTEDPLQLLLRRNLRKRGYDQSYSEARTLMMEEQNEVLRGYNEEAQRQLEMAALQQAQRERLHTVRKEELDFVRKEQRLRKKVEDSELADRVDLYEEFDAKLATIEEAARYEIAKEMWKASLRSTLEKRSRSLVRNEIKERSSIVLLQLFHFEELVRFASTREWMLQLNTLRRVFVSARSKLEIVLETVAKAKWQREMDAMFLHLRSDVNTAESKSRSLLLEIEILDRSQIFAEFLKGRKQISEAEIALREKYHRERSALIEDETKVRYLQMTTLWLDFEDLHRRHFQLMSSSWYTWFVKKAVLLNEIVRKKQSLKTSLSEGRTAIMKEEMLDREMRFRLFLESTTTLLFRNLQTLSYISQQTVYVVEEIQKQQLLESHSRLQIHSLEHQSGEALFRMELFARELALKDRLKENEAFCICLLNERSALEERAEPRSRILIHRAENEAYEVNLRFNLEEEELISREQLASVRMINGLCLREEVERSAQYLLELVDWEALCRSFLVTVEVSGIMKQAVAFLGFDERRNRYALETSELLTFEELLRQRYGQEEFVELRGINHLDRLLAEVMRQRLSFYGRELSTRAKMWEVETQARENLQREALTQEIYSIYRALRNQMNQSLSCIVFNTGSRGLGDAEHRSRCAVSLDECEARQSIDRKWLEDEHNCESLWIVSRSDMELSALRTKRTLQSYINLEVDGRRSIVRDELTSFETLQRICLERIKDKEFQLSLDIWMERYSRIQWTNTFANFKGALLDERNTIRHLEWIQSEETFRHFLDVQRSLEISLLKNQLLTSIFSQLTLELEEVQSNQRLKCAKEEHHVYENIVRLLTHELERSNRDKIYQKALDDRQIHAMARARVNIIEEEVASRVHLEISYLEQVEALLRLSDESRELSTRRHLANNARNSRDVTAQVEIILLEAHARFRIQSKEFENVETLCRASIQDFQQFDRDLLEGMALRARRSMQEAKFRYRLRSLEAEEVSQRTAVERLQIESRESDVRDSLNTVFISERSSLTQLHKEDFARARAVEKSRLEREMEARKHARLIAELKAKARKVAPPFFGFSLAESSLGRTLVIDALYEGGPAQAVGMGLGDELHSIGKDAVKSLADVRRAVKLYAKVGESVEVMFRESKIGAPMIKVEVLVLTSNVEYLSLGEGWFFDTNRSVKHTRETLDGSKPAKSFRRVASINESSQQ